MHAKQRNEAIRHVVAYVFTIAMVFLQWPRLSMWYWLPWTKEQIYDPSQIIPTHITFDNFRQVLFQSNFVRYFMNSIFITLVTTLICMILSVMAAYGLTRYRIVGAGKIKMAVLMTRMFPGILLCIPYYIIMKQLNLIDSYIGLILMYCSFTLPFAIWNTCAFLFPFRGSWRKLPGLMAATGWNLSFMWSFMWLSRDFLLQPCSVLWHPGMNICMLLFY